MQRITLFFASAVLRVLSICSGVVRRGLRTLETSSLELILGWVEHTHFEYRLRSVKVLGLVPREFDSRIIGLEPMVKSQATHRGVLPLQMEFIVDV